MRKLKNSFSTSTWMDGSSSRPVVSFEFLKYLRCILLDCRKCTRSTTCASDIADWKSILFAASLVSIRMQVINTTDMLEQMWLGLTKWDRCQQLLICITQMFRRVNSGKLLMIGNAKMTFCKYSVRLLTLIYPTHFEHVQCQSGVNHGKASHIIAKKNV